MPTAPKQTFYNRQRAIIALAWPMILSNLSIPLLGIVDTAILGHLNSAIYLGAVAIGSSILTYLFWGFGFLRMGSTAIVASAYGREEFSRCESVLWQSLLLAGIIGLLLTVAHPWLFPLILQVMDPPEDISALALSYCSIRIWSAPAALANYAIIGWFIGLQNTRVPLLIMVASNLINILFDAILVMGYGLNSDGAAYATVIADCSGLVIGLTAVSRELLRLPGRAKRDEVLSIALLIKLLHVNRHLFVRTATLLFVITFFIAQGSHLSTDILAANAILLQLMAITSYSLDSFAHAAEALVGKSIGQRNLYEVRKVCVQTTLWSLMGALLLTLTFWLGSNLIIHGFTQLENVITATQRYYPWIIALPLISAIGYQMDGIFIGLNQSQGMQNTMVVSALLVFFPLWWLTQGWGNHGLWLAFLLFNASRSLLMAVLLQSRFRSGGNALYS